MAYETTAISCTKDEWNEVVTQGEDVKIQMNQRFEVSYAAYPYPEPHRSVQGWAVEKGGIFTIPADDTLRFQVHVKPLERDGTAVVIKDEQGGGGGGA